MLNCVRMAPVVAASNVEILNNLIASLTCCSVATFDNVIRAKDSEILTMASSWRTVIGIAEEFPSSSRFLTADRIVT